MSTFTGNNVSSNDVIYAADHNTLVSLIAAVLNGGIDNANINAAAAIDGSKLADTSIATAKLANAAATPAKWTNPYCFRAGASGVTTLTNGASVKVAFANDSTSNCYDLNSNYSTANSQYTAPFAAIYSFSGTVYVPTATTVTALMATLYVNGSERARGTFMPNTAKFSAVHVTADLTLAANDLVELRCYVEGTGTIQNEASVATNWFSGHLVALL